MDDSSMVAMAMGELCAPLLWLVVLLLLLLLIIIIGNDSF